MKIEIKNHTTQANSTNEFEGHWKEHFAQDIPELKYKEAKQFVSTLLQHMSPIARPIRVIDAGCGDGVHAQAWAELVSHSQNSNLESSVLIGIDQSQGALASARSRSLTACEFMCASIDQVPLESNSLDGIICFGVLGYTPNPRATFNEFARLLAPGGVVGIWLFPKQNGVSGWALGFIRWLCKLGGSFTSRVIADLMVPLMFVLPSRSGLHLLNASWKQCREVLLVTIVPQNLIFPTELEIEKWYHDNHIEIIAEDKAHPKTLWGRKKT